MPRHAPCDIEYPAALPRRAAPRRASQWPLRRGRLEMREGGWKEGGEGNMAALRKAAGRSDPVVRKHAYAF